MKSIPLLVPWMPKSHQIMRYLDMIDSNRWYTNFGPLNQLFEQRILELTNPRPASLHVTTVCNCTAGMELALQASGLTQGARVLLPAITFVATATAVIRAGMVPVFSDLDPTTWVLTPQIARHAIAERRIDGIMTVSTFGYPHDPTEWDALAAEFDVPVIIDAAGAFGNQGVGEFTDVVFSFHATKSFGAAEGGAVLSANFERIARIRRLSNFGIDTSRGVIDEIGTNAKMSEYHSAVGLATCDTWDGIKADRRSLAQRYTRAIAAKVPAVRFQNKPDDGIYPLMAILTPPHTAAAQVAAKLSNTGIETRRWYCPPLYAHPALKQAEKMTSTAIADDLGHRILGLPFFLGMTDDQIDRVVTALSESLRS